MDYPVSKIVLQTVHKLWCLSTNMRNLPCDPPQGPGLIQGCRFDGILAKNASYLGGGVYFCTCGCPQADSARRQGHSHQASHPTRVEGAQPNHRTNKTTATQPKEPSHGWGRNPITQPRLIHALQTGKKLRQEKHQYATDHEEVLPWTVVQMVFWTNVNQACRLWTSTMLWPWRTQPKREDNISPGLGGISWSGGRLGHSHTIWSQVPRHEQPSQTQSVVG